MELVAANVALILVITFISGFCVFAVLWPLISKKKDKE
jgi:hypothetical protein